jgi:hypothetical protein
VVRRLTEAIEMENLDPFNLPDARGTELMKSHTPTSIF